MNYMDTIKFLAKPCYYNSPNGNSNNEDLYLNSTDTTDDIHKVNLNDIKFYRKRVFALFKNILKGIPPPNKELKKIHDEYVISIILYFKMQDMNDILQQDYIDANDANDVNDANDANNANDANDVNDANDANDANDVNDANDANDYMKILNEDFLNISSLNNNNNNRTELITPIPKSGNLDNYVEIIRPTINLTDTSAEMENQIINTTRYIFPTKKEINLKTPFLKKKGIPEKNKNSVEK
jgi:hypothetical protein